MFKQARIKLTLWYLLIIMFVSIFFSLVIHRGLIAEVNRVTRMEQLRFERGSFDYRVFHPAFLDPEIIEEIKRRITFGLITINGIIFVSAGALGYFLAGKTLRPIQEMVNEQNRFISDASHELRTPLTSLKTSIEVGLRDKDIDLESAKKLINENLLEINKLQSLSENLLQLTQYKSGDNHLKFEKVPVKKIINEVFKKIEIIAKEKKIEIRNKAGNYFVRGNKYSLTDLFIILLDNAVKYSRAKSEVIISTKKNNKTVSIFFKDKGMGIAEKDLPHVFDRFYRADKARGRDGYGLGLAIAKKIVESHGGEIKIESKLEEGTTVKVSLPIFS
ncbi:hypothetical protein HZA76_02865 [Candidatus Roizmanbacteria bacterium]|nr:hypothetical protein [Candidatus Roizmanbacteria bacterium]